MLFAVVYDWTCFVLARPNFPQLTSTTVTLVNNSYTMLTSRSDCLSDSASNKCTHPITSHHTFMHCTTPHDTTWHHMRSLLLTSSQTSAEKFFFRVAPPLDRKAQRWRHCLGVPAAQRGGGLRIPARWVSDACVWWGGARLLWCAVLCYV